jgi:tRNA (guanine-N(7)-)-methyltransferase subunit TRM82
MASFGMPYQCMVKGGNLLFAASGSKIDLFNIQDGSLISTWKCPLGQNISQNNQSSSEAISSNAINHKLESSSINIEHNASSPPAKKRKLSEPGNGNGQQFENGEGGRKNNRFAAVASGLDAPAILALAVTRDCQHVIAVTGEDKSIRVFANIQEDGKQILSQISKR